MLEKEFYWDSFLIEKEEQKTSFGSSAMTFAQGVGSILNIYDPHHYTRLSGLEKRDDEMIGEYWRQVGTYLNTSLLHYDREHGEGAGNGK